MVHRRVFSVRIKKSLVKPLKLLSVELEVSLGQLVEKAFCDLLRKHRVSIPKDKNCRG